MNKFYTKHSQFFSADDIIYLMSHAQGDTMLQDSPVMSRIKRTIIPTVSLEKRYNEIVREAQKKYNVAIYEPISYEKFIYSIYKKENYIRTHNDLCEKLSPYSRKLTIVALLNNEFEGGEFKMMMPEFFNTGMIPVPLAAGDLIIFPSYVPHEVSTVTNGERITLTTWVKGPNWT